MIINRDSKSALKRAGFTLVELTIVILVGSIIAMMSLALFNHQLVTYRIISTQNFLIHEAPQIDNSLNRVTSRANFFRLYPTLNDAQAGTNATITDAQVIALRFSGIGTTASSFGVISFDSTDDTLTYYHLASMAELANAGDDDWRKLHSWTISSQVDDASFFVQNGVLRFKLTGPNGAEIIYSTTTLR